MQVDKIGRVTTTGLVDGDDETRRAIDAARPELASRVGVGDDIRLIAECRIDFAQGNKGAAAVAAGRDGPAASSRA